MSFSSSNVMGCAVGAVMGITAALLVLHSGPSVAPANLYATTTTSTSVRAQSLNAPHLRAPTQVYSSAAEIPEASSATQPAQWESVQLPAASQSVFSSVNYAVSAACMMAGLFIGIRAFQSKPAANNPLGVKRYGAQDLAMAATYSITIETPDGEKVIECKDDQYILDAAEDAGLDLPYSCRTGSCSTCAAKLVDGEVDQGDQAFLGDAEVEAGYFVPCQSYPKSDVKMLSHQEDAIWDMSKMG